jgi:hypothetical protein
VQLGNDQIKKEEFVQYKIGRHLFCLDKRNTCGRAAVIF